MWTFTLAHGGLRTGRSSTPALLTPGYKNLAGGAGKHTKNERLFHELWLYKCVCCHVNVCVRRGVQLNDGRWKEGMCAKEGNQGMFF